MTILLTDDPRGDVGLEWTVSTGTAVQALVELSHLASEGTDDPNLSRALAGIGDRSGETWLHLLGICVELGAPRSYGQLFAAVSAMDALELRSLLLGGRAWSWRSIAGADTIEAAARGDREAARRLLADDRYYGGRAADALTTILALGSAETRRRLLAALEAYGQARDPDELDEPLRRLRREVQSSAREGGWIPAVERATGYRYLPEPEARRVVLMPHLAGRGLTLAQHDDARLIVYGEAPPRPPSEQLVELGRALSDPTRVRMLAALGAGPLQLGELMELTGSTRSTVHHHLRVLRAAGLVAVEGNARSYRYRIGERGGETAVDLLADLLAVARVAKG